MCVCVCVCVQVHVHKIIIFAIHLEYYCVYSSSRNVRFAVPYKVVFSVELNLKVYRYIQMLTCLVKFFSSN